LGNHLNREEVQLWLNGLIFLRGFSKNI